MPAPTIQIVVFDTSDSSFHPTPEHLLPTFKQVKAMGINPLFYTGVEAANPKVSFIVVQWDNYEQHQKVAQSPSYPELAKSLVPILSGPNPATGPSKHQIYHVEFSGPTVAFDQPVTEVNFVTLKNPANRGAVVGILSKCSAESGNRLVFGQTREDKNKYVIVCGWPTVEARKQAAAKPEVAAALQQLYSLADKNLYHVKLTKRF